MIELCHVTKIYNHNKPNEYIALKDVSLTIDDGESVAIVGGSGAGKSTLMHLIGCVDTCEEGTIKIDGEELHAKNDCKSAKIRNEKVGIVLQDFGLISEYTVLENVEIPLLFAGVSARERKKRCLAVLKNVGMEKLANKLVSQLSGGQKQRVAISRAVVNEPSVLLADEPTGALDSKTGEEIFSLLMSFHKQGKTVVIITHNPDLAARCERQITVSDGVITADSKER